MNNNLPLVTFIFDRYKKATSTIKASVELRITYNYKQKYISTGIMLCSNQWKKDTIVNCPDSIQLNNYLSKLLTQVRQVILDMADTDSIDIFSIPERLQRMNRKEVSLLEFFEQRASVRKYGKAPDSQERYNRFLRLFKEWGGITTFKDITEDNIIKYDKYLDSTGMKAYSKWNNYHRFLNSFILDALDAGILHKNPYKWVNIEKGKDTKSIKRHLTSEEFNKLKRAKMPTKSLERVRDLFIFQTYTCLSYKDLSTFKIEDCIDIKGIKVYTGNRIKTNKPFTIPLLPPAMGILNKYNNNLPIISNVKYNEYLKIVAQTSGIDKPLSSHWARHTGATLLLNEGVDIKIISKICGHSSTRITEQVYASLLDETIIDAVKELEI